MGLGTCPGSGGLGKMTSRWELWATPEIASEHSVALVPEFMVLSQRSPCSLALLYRRSSCSVSTERK